MIVEFALGEDETRTLRHAAEVRGLTLEEFVKSVVFEAVDEMSSHGLLDGWEGDCE